MNKIEEMIESSSVYFEYEDDKHEVYRLMKEYAEYYAKQCLEIAESHIFEDVYCAEIYPTEIKLPDHE